MRMSETCRNNNKKKKNNNNNSDDPLTSRRTNESKNLYRKRKKLPLFCTEWNFEN